MEYREKDSDYHDNDLSYYKGINDDLEEKPLLPSTSLRSMMPLSETAIEMYPVEGTRWWVLFWFAYISSLQSLLWFTYSSVPDHSQAFLNVDSNTLIMFLDEGPIAFCVTVWYANWLLARPGGLRKSIITAAVLCFLGASIRCLPLIDALHINHSVMVVLVHVAQTLNAAAAPFVVASVSTLSLEWFAEAERNTATAVGNVASAAGRAVAYYLGPAMVHTPAQLKHLLALEAALALVPLLAVAVHLPAGPAKPPSRGALEVVEMYGTARGKHGSPDVRGLAVLWTELKGVVAKPAFVLLVVSGGVNMGLYGMWSGVLPAVLPSSWGDAEAGYFGLANTLCGIVGGVLAGVLTDVRSMQQRLRTVTGVALVLAGILFAVFAAALPPVSWHPLHTLAESRAPLLVVCSLAGFFRGVTDPLFFELSAEAAYPFSAGTAGSVLTFGYHVALVISLSLPSSVLTRWSLTAMAVAMGFCTVLVVFARVQYQRR
eukprot:m.132997 g.132997  ORF g.132997 m.132997 type:complete len:487 (+) comp17519_c0_seq1:330-1790(+)